MLTPSPNLTAYILAGGRSSRMGCDKAFLEWNGQSLLSRSLRLAQSVAAEVRIVGPAAKFSTFAQVVEDTFTGCGPLGGIHAALSRSATDQNLILAVDMPFLTTDFLTYLAERAQSSDAAITIPRTAEGWQPLCAIYRRAFAPIAEAALKSGENKIDRLFQSVSLDIITSKDLHRYPPNEFHNLNTPKDFAETGSVSPQPKAEVN